MSSSDFSTFALFTAGLAVFAPIVAAATAPTNVPGGSTPTGPAIYQPNLNAVVPAGTAFSVTWKEGVTDCDKIDLILLKGPSSDKMAAIAYIAQGLDNTGSYAWTPDTTLEPSKSDYGIELVCQSSQAYQYTTRFGISNDAYSGSSGSSSSSSASSSSSSSASSMAPYPTTTGKSNSTASGTASSSGTKSPAVTGGSGYANSSSNANSPTTGASPIPTTHTSTALTTATTKPTTTVVSSSQSSAGAAMNVKASFGSLVGALAVAAFAL